MSNEPKNTFWHDAHLAFHTISRIITLLCCVAALFQLVSLSRPDISAIQQCAAASIAVATVVIPYIFTRMVEPWTLPPPAPQVPLDPTKI